MVEEVVHVVSAHRVHVLGERMWVDQPSVAWVRKEREEQSRSGERVVGVIHPNQGD